MLVYVILFMFLLVLLESATALETNFSNTLKLSYGQIRGVKHTTSTGRRANTFLGIPYAEPPVDKLRFQKTVPKSPWSGILDCRAYKPACLQTKEKIFQSEDCLYLNVFSSPDCSHGSPCPVLYFIHGGANEFLSPILYPIDTVINNFAWNDIVVVTVSYRLGVLGFWSTGTDDAMGNWALYDLIEGLKWTRSEISKFGGNPDHVTIWGYSSSSILISLLTLTDKTRGLIHQSLPMSAGGYHDFMIDNNFTIYHDLAEKLACSGDRLGGISNAVLECMRKVDAQAMIKMYDKIRNYDPLDPAQPPRVTWPRNDGADGLFPVSVAQMTAKRRPIRTLTGNTRNEMGTYKTTMINTTADTVRDTCRFLIENLRFQRKDQLLGMCVERYVENPDYRAVAPASKFSFWTEQAVELMEDCEFFAFTFQECWTLARAGATVYLYSFDYEKKGEEGISTSHGQDMDYLTDPLSPESVHWDDRDLAIKAKYITALTNFIKFGNPTPEQDQDGLVWPKFVPSITKNRYYSFNLPPKILTGFHSSGVQFWDFDVASVENRRYEKLSKILENNKSESQVDGGNNWPTTILYMISTLALVALLVAAIVLLQKRRHYSRI